MCTGLGFFTVESQAVTNLVMNYVSSIATVLRRTLAMVKLNSAYKAYECKI